ncbi:putative quinol monooxygenase [Hansschlegelia sp.]|uniref:putative quinol monooxygenase n=1 Tax=Hansschlegelia sp. TaxID=2041892 RepID=UPI002BA170E3|nr:putative quinol monooxygenase [Hansschlegelia sp.]HVI28693.1 putative quinol monooxygenase [Hansschlegelia sp.]
MSDVAGVIEFNAKPGRGAEVARLIADALPHVEAETGTPLWLVIRSKADPDAVFLVDLFTNDAALDAHMTGKAAEQIFRTVPPLLSGDPKIHPAEVIARKGA